MQLKKMNMHMKSVDSDSVWRLFNFFLAEHIPCRAGVRSSRSRIIGQVGSAREHLTDM